jgi:hypothetical protein
MKTTPTKRRGEASTGKATRKAAPKKLVAVRKAAQNPTHATRATIRRAVRAVVAEWREANA